MDPQSILHTNINLDTHKPPKEILFNQPSTSTPLVAHATHNFADQLILADIMTKLEHQWYYPEYYKHDGEGCQCSLPPTRDLVYCCLMATDSSPAASQSESGRIKSPLFNWLVRFLHIIGLKYLIKIQK